jgi:hypothetical protein
VRNFGVKQFGIEKLRIKTGLICFGAWYQDVHLAEGDGLVWRQAPRFSHLIRDAVPVVIDGSEPSLWIMFLERAQDPTWD